MDETKANNQLSKNVVPEKPIVEAQAWVKGTDGSVTLVAVAPATPSLLSANCSH